MPVKARTPLPLVVSSRAVITAGMVMTNSSRSLISMTLGRFTPTPSTRFLNIFAPERRISNALTSQEMAG